MMPTSSGFGGQGLQPVAQPHPLHLPISSPPAFQWCLLGAPPHAPLTPRGEGQAEMPEWPQDPLVPRLLPPALPPHLGKGFLAACLTPMESHKPTPGPLRPQGLTPASPLFICPALRKAA